jgi:hypothetical protein
MNQKIIIAFHYFPHRREHMPTIIENFEPISVNLADPTCVYEHRPTPSPWRAKLGIVCREKLHQSAKQPASSFLVSIVGSGDVFSTIAVIAPVVGCFTYHRYPYHALGALLLDLCPTIRLTRVVAVVAA